MQSRTKYPWVDGIQHISNLLLMIPVHDWINVVSELEVEWVIVAGLVRRDGETDELVVERDLIKKIPNDNHLEVDIFADQSASHNRKEYWSQDRFS